MLSAEEIKRLRGLCKRSKEYALGIPERLDLLDALCEALPALLDELGRLRSMLANLCEAVGPLADIETGGDDYEEVVLSGHQLDALRSALARVNLS